MNLTERFDAATAKMDELKEKLEKASEEIKNSWNQGIENFKSDMSDIKASVEEIANEKEAEEQAEREERKEKFNNAVGAVKESFADGASNYNSDMEILRASLRNVAVEIDEQTEIADAEITAKREARVEAARAKIAETKAKINDLAVAIGRADQEELILDLLSYAEECQELADEMADEAELALKAAAQQIALYNAKYGVS